MFPIPFNFPFRKSNGAMTTIGDAISEGGGSYTLPTASANTKGGVKIGSGLSMSGEVLNATAELPAYSSATAGKVLTVDENGDLEWDTKGSGGGDEFIKKDFTQYGTRTMHGVSYNNSGASFSGSGTSTLRDYIEILEKSVSYAYNNITIYIDVKSLNVDNYQHRRFIMGANNAGLIYRDTGKWAFYSDSWVDSDITAGDFFDNCTIKVYIDSSDKWHIYKNGVLVFDPSIALTSYFIRIGSEDDKSLYNGAVFTGVRVYSGDYTE